MYRRDPPYPLPDIREGPKPWSAPRLRGRGKQGNIVMHT